MGSSLTYMASAIRWIAFVAALVFFVGIFALLTLFFHHTRLEFWLRAFARTMVAIAGIDLRVRGTENLDRAKAYVFVFNHTNLFDLFAIYLAIPQVARGVEREDHFRWPVYGLFLRRVGQVPIPPRGDTRRAIAALDKAKALFRSGISVAIAPEGTRSATGELLPFKKGAFHLALDLEADVAPVVLRGMYAIQRKGGWLIRPGTVDVEFLPPIPTRGLAGDAIPRLRDETRALFVARMH